MWNPALNNYRRVNKLGVAHANEIYLASTFNGLESFYELQTSYAINSRYMYNRTARTYVLMNPLQHTNVVIFILLKIHASLGNS